MRRNRLLFGAVSLLGLAIVLLTGGVLLAQNPLEQGTVLGRTEIPDADGMEAVLVLREIPPGGASGRHAMGAGSEIVYILEGSFVVEVDGMPAVTVDAGSSFQTVAGQVHNVKNASSEAGGKALAFYITKQGTELEDISLPVE